MIRPRLTPTPRDAVWVAVGALAVPFGMALGHVLAGVDALGSDLPARPTDERPNR